MRARLISETLDEAGLGLKIRVEAPVERASLPSIGEAWARAHRDRAGKVWVWLYGYDMDEEGPAIGVTFLEQGREPVFDFVPASTLLLYYMGSSAEPLAHGVAPRA